jgi:predicted helicase
MSIHAIKQYQLEVEKIIHFGGTKKETAIRNAFYNLLNEYANQKGLIMVPEITVKTLKGKNVTPDGTLKDSLRQDWGYWESKDEADDIDDEIKKKFAKDYPSDNILFEDSQTAILFQAGKEVLRIKMKDAEKLDAIINAFINFERPEVKNFRIAIERFKQDIPKVTDTLRDILEEQEKSNKTFVKKRDTFLKLCHDSINPEVTKLDVREMTIQHILTEDIFNTIFDETQFHRENNIARELEAVINTFFTGALKKTALAKLQSYSKAINAAAASIPDHHEKQKFLKVVYETFYKSYNPKAADRLGVVYTPSEIVKFMIESTDYLLNKHFGKFLEDKGVEILDPATGTGTFICDIIDYLSKDKLEYKYKNEIHANEVAILPYYISNLNIEFTYSQKMGKYNEFENLCFVDTLDNMGFAYRGKQIDLFAPFTEINSKRIYKQNTKKISVIIGNPPYNANQANENDNNKNREYPIIDKRIKDTYVKFSRAQKTKVYDMYSRFYRWAMDRIDDKGVIAFITNNSFINSKTFDGFRKVVQDEFQHAYIIDLGGNIRELSGKDGIFLNEKHTIFGQAAAVGIAIMFLIKDKSPSIKNKKQDKNNCIIKYIHPTDIRATRDEKLTFLSENPFKGINFEHIIPDSTNNWLNIADNDFDSLIPLIGNNSVFDSNSLGVSTNRDEWVYDLDSNNLSKKIKYFINKYDSYLISNKNKFDSDIKWSSSLKSAFLKRKKINYDKSKIIYSLFRPFIKRYFYSEKLLNDRLTANHYKMFGNNLAKTNKVICFNNNGKDFRFLATDKLFDLHYTGDTNSLSLFNYDEKGNRIDNITDWGLNIFIKQYGKNGITKESIFNYVYAVFHNKKYLEKYESNLKREFPRIPFYKDFKKWSDFGKRLLDLHVNYENAKQYPLKITSKSVAKNPKVKLKADKSKDTITIDENTLLSGIPKIAWAYKLGNRSALEWILDQYKEKKSTDKTIIEHFDNYSFAEYKEDVIVLLRKICSVSVDTMEIIEDINNTPN